MLLYQTFYLIKRDIFDILLEENSRILKKLSLKRLSGKKVLTETNKNSLLDEENIINE